MRVSVELILDSKSPAGARLTTFRCVVPKFLLAQIARHRMLSISAGSSRAIPTSKAIEGDVYVPERWPVAGPGMVPKAYVDGKDVSSPNSFGSEWDANEWWAYANQAASYTADGLARAGIHKQVSNRPLEPYMMTPVILTATQWSNFLALRTSLVQGETEMVPEAQVEAYELACEIERLLRENEPRALNHGQWHLPFITSEDVDYAYETRQGCEAYESFRFASAARCARTTTARPGVSVDYDKDVKMGKQLIADRHISPFEHQGQALSLEQMAEMFKVYMGRVLGGELDAPTPFGNHVGWLQARKFIANESDAGVK